MLNIISVPIVPNVELLKCRFNATMVNICKNFENVLIAIDENE
jgi:hypothetical protein